MAQKMTEDRLHRLFAAYGADPRRWPAIERRQAIELLEARPDLKAARRRAAELDSLLDGAPAPQPSGELIADILSEIGRPAWRRWSSGFWPFGPVWQPAAGLALAALLGVALGLATATPVDIAQMTAEVEDLILG